LNLNVRNGQLHANIKDWAINQHELEIEGCWFYAKQFKAYRRRSIKINLCFPKQNLGLFLAMLQIIKII